MSYKLLIFYAAVVAASVDPIIELPTGKIRGRQATTYANTSYYSFQKIPYASPPIGSLRFKAPQPVQKWVDVLDATKIDVTCYQLSGNPTTDSEDCLFVNVYTPKLSEDNASFPVMFFIHGGAFIQGSGIYMPPDLYVDNDVILVTVNYRLGAFGFLSTGDEVIPGNNGLKDQRLAIQWTKENIHLFGGNPEKITIFGQSAGSASAAYQLLNLNSEGLFWGAILESGSFLSSWSYQRNARNFAFHVGTILNQEFSKNNDSKALFTLLQNVTADELDNATEKFLLNVSTTYNYDIFQGCFFAPVIEVKHPDAFLTRKMYGLLEAGNIIKVPTMLGFTSEESLPFNSNADILQKNLAIVDKDLDLLVPNDMLITDPHEHAKMAVSIRNIYTKGEDFGTNLGAFVRFSSDTSFSKPITKHAELYSKLAPTYFYQFSYHGKLGNNNVHYDGAESVGHSEELPYIFCSGNSCDFSSFSEEDQMTSKRMIKLWTNFAKYQNPTPELSDILDNVTWPQVSVTEGDVLYLNINETLEVMNHPKEEVVAKWFELYNILGDKDFDTY